MSRIPSIEELAGQVILKEACGETDGTGGLQTPHAGIANAARGDCQRRTRGLLTPHAGISDATASIDVSVVTVCFNPFEAGRKEMFQRNLDSVQQQDGVRLEHLIIDGASTDGTVEWLESYNNTRHDIRFLSRPDNGIYEAMNRGIALARGKHVIFLNSDDYFHEPSGMAHSIEKIEYYGCDFSFAPVRFSDPSVCHNPQLAPQRRLHRFLISWSFSHQSMLTSCALLKRLDGFDTAYRSAADYDLLLRMIEAGAKGCFVPLAFSTFTLGGFSFAEDNADLIEEECTRSLQQFYRNLFKVEMTHDEAAYVIRRRVFPSKYIDLYKQTQQLIRERFVGVPDGPMAHLSRWFNYYKYYYKCLNANA